MIEVKIKNPGDEHEFDKAVRLFKKIVNKAGFLRELKENRYYSKPSEKRRKKRNEKKRRK